jgi:sarcosine oxidase subunit delta
MKILHCPINGPRPIDEFAFGGEQRETPDPQTCSDSEWADYVFHRNGAPCVKKEWWYHVPSGTWFVAERNTSSDVVERTYLWGEA